MPENSLTVFIIAIAAALAVGFLLAYLVQNGKIASLKIAESKAREELFLQISEKEKALAIKETEYFNVKAALEAANAQNSELAEKNQQLVAELQKTAAHAASVEASNKHIEEWIAKADTSLKDSFASISKNIAENNNRVFLETANDKVGGIVMPVSKELKELRDKVEELESKRARAYGELNERVDDLKKQNSELKNATDLLNNTLKNNAQRGKWGEEQLRRIAELAGMVEHIDFEEQSVNAEGSRPDMVIHLTGGRTVPVDSKAPMASYLHYLDDTSEEARAKHLAEHVKNLRTHIDALYKKAYWKSEDRSVEMVAMVVPYESGLSAAFATDKEIFGYAMEKNVLLLSPMTFYAFLKSVSIGWQENAMSQNAKEIAKQSKELINRFGVFFKYFENIDKALTTARDNYDKAVSSYNRRLLPAFNRFEVLSNGTEAEAETLSLPDENL